MAFIKRILLVYGLLLMLFSGCNSRQREKELEQKISEVNQKEQQLLLREKNVELKELELAEREKSLDSTKNIMSTDSLTDSIQVIDSSLNGTWLVQMRCTETSCPGSAVGDTRTEQWVISYQQSTVLAKAMSGQTLNRVYTGHFTGGILQLSSEYEETISHQMTKMIVRLQKTRENNMEGRREILRPDGCKIVYALGLSKQ